MYAPAFSLLILNGVFCLANGRTFTVGVLIPTTGPWPIGRQSASAALIARDNINKDPTLTMLRRDNHTVDFVWRDTQCDASTGLKHIVDIWSNKGADALIGPACDAICEPGALLAAAWEIPMISYGCISTILSDKETYPTFARTLPPSENLDSIIFAIASHYNWTRIALVPSAAYHWTLTAVFLQDSLESWGLDVIYVSMFEGQIKEKHSTRTGKTHTQVLSEVKERVRVFFLLCYPGDARDFMIHAAELEMLNGDYAFFTTEMVYSSFQGVQTWQGDDGKDQQAKQALEGTIDITVYEPKNQGKYADFIAEVKQRMSDQPFYIEFPPGEGTDSHAPLLYDAMMLYAVALNKTIAEVGDIENGTEVSKRLFNISFTGVNGKEVEIDQNGNRFPNYNLKNVVNGYFVEVGIYNVSGAANHRLKITDNIILWPGGGRNPPKGHPACGWNGEFCIVSDNSYNDMIVIVVVLTVVVFGASIFPIIFTRMRRKAQHNMNWKVNWLEIQVMDTIKNASSSSSSNWHGKSTKSKSFLQSNDFGANLSLSSGDTIEGDKHNSKTTSDMKQVFAPVGRYNGQLVALRKVNKPFVHVSNAILSEINQVRSINHPNINTFIGACIDPEHLCLVTIYCTKGSLQDVLENENIKIDFTFQMSFLNDIVKAMLYIQSSELKSHGKLRSSNVLVDSRWTCKIGGLGLHQFLEGEREEEGEAAIFFKKLWTAPDLLRQNNAQPEGNSKGDVYSFGIILHEIMQRNGPFGSPPIRPKEIIERVKYGEHPPFRPLIHSTDLSPDIIELMRACWEENPNLRPTFTGIRDKLKAFTKGKQINVVDQMIHMMEKYANHLEELIEERAARLTAEQKKTEELLCRMLPKQVALELRQGRVLQPETYNQVTVMFSDIVGFTALSSESTPVQIVEFLNDLYTSFDQTIENLDVYKVETIGDAYMCVSGCPVRNGKQHVGEIATLGLEFLSTVVTFKIRHRPGRQLQLRIGMHTGSVASGVVGVKMPRYCLFGNTVNYASRMESSGHALRIHVSPESRKVLMEIGGYEVIERGPTKIRGKGIITTYFLVGKDGYDKVLPDMSTTCDLDDDIHKTK